MPKTQTHEPVFSLADFEDYDELEDCPNCGGEGILYDCIDGCCLDAEEGCDLCAYKCDWCQSA